MPRVTHRTHHQDRADGAEHPRASGYDEFPPVDSRAWGTRAGEREEPAVAAPTPSTGVAELEGELAAVRAAAEAKERRLQEQLAAYQEQLARQVEETKERLRRDAQKELQLARGELVQGFLGVLDNLHRSLRAADEHRSVAPLLEGLRLVEGQLEGQLAALGLARIAALGQPFDPARHEAVTLVPVEDPAADGTVVAELQAGYTFGDRVLRPARVAVGRRRT
jgi:molecular chaperone GrpE (heat shock protein)